MTPQELFQYWAPPASPWSLWAKPVLFACMGEVAPSPSAALPPYPIEWAPEPWATHMGDGAPEATYRAQAVVERARPTEGTAIIVELPALESIATGVSLAARGYRPVPLFNTTRGDREVIGTAPIQQQLTNAAAEIFRMTLPPDAPPAFLLDSERLRGIVGPGIFDNRWRVFPQDFPSGNFLRSQRIERIIVAANGGPQVAEYLAHVLVRWTEQGLALRSKDVRAPGEPAPLEVPRPSGFRMTMYRAMAMVGLRRNSAGGFGGLIPVPPPPGSGSGYRGGFG